jgi:proteic killer suppression protein
MLETFRHKGLKRLFEDADSSGVRADQVPRIRDVLAHLDLARYPRDLDLPGYRLHSLRGELEGPLERDNIRQLADRFPLRGWRCF